MEQLFTYPEPEKNPNCLCLQNGGGLGAAFFCQTGHMTECHSGMVCRTARCSHLPRYDEDDSMGEYTIENAPRWSVKGLGDGKQLLALEVYAPSAVLAEQIVQEWVSGTENLSKLSLAYTVVGATL